MEYCKVLAEVTIEGLSAMGKAPAIGTYVCVASAANPITAAVSPAVCAGTVAATTIGNGLTIQGLPLQKLQKRLWSGGVILWFRLMKKKLN